MATLTVEEAQRQLLELIHRLHPGDRYFWINRGALYFLRTTTPLPKLTDEGVVATSEILF
jgi:hypothetical protein